MSIWRIYRVPGSKEFWHIDSGIGTIVFNVTKFEIFCPCKSIDVGNGMPRAWIEIDQQDELHFFDGVAVFGKMPISPKEDYELHVLCGKTKPSIDETKEENQ